MTKVRVIVNGALGRLRNTDSTEEPTPEDSALALAALNRMEASWRHQGVDVGHETYANVNADFDLDAAHEKGVIALLAVEIADDLGKPITNQVRRDAVAGWQAIVADYWLQDPMRVDRALANMPSQRHYRATASGAYWKA